MEAQDFLASPGLTHKHMLKGRGVQIPAASGSPVQLEPEVVQLLSESSHVTGRLVFLDQVLVSRLDHLTQI